MMAIKRIIARASDPRFDNFIFICRILAFIIESREWRKIAILTLIDYEEN
jgi:hypothetical protein